jgi:exodeoxyribonuclease-5
VPKASTAPSTIHSLIYTPKPQKAETLERELEGEGPTSRQGGVRTPPNGDKKSYLNRTRQARSHPDQGPRSRLRLNDLRFTLNFDSILVKEAIKLIVCDEASMVGAEVAEDMMSFEIPILAMGDPGQLPPVGDKPGFLVGSPDALLTEVHRQAAENPIIHIATMVRKGQRADYGDYGNGVLIVPPRRTSTRSISIATPRSSSAPTRPLEDHVQAPQGGRHRVHPADQGRAADHVQELAPAPERWSTARRSGRPRITAMPRKVRRASSIHIRDEERQAPLSDVRLSGPVRGAHQAREELLVGSKPSAYRARINDNHIDFGWAITCHKSQGSQWDEVDRPRRIRFVPGSRRSVALHRRHPSGRAARHRR